MSKLDQLQIVYVPEQDRLLLRVNTADRTEFRFWLTRRLVKLLWPALLQTLEANLPAPVTHNEAARDTVMAFQHEKALSSADFKTPYRNDAARLPLGEEPLLVTRVQIKPAPNNTRVLFLHPTQGQGIGLSLDATMIHALCELLKTTVESIDWTLELRGVQQEVVVETPAERLN